MPGTILQDIRRNVSAMILHRIGSVAVFGTDNFLIAKFVGIVTTGLYSNYMMIRGFLNVVINALFSGITPVMGKLNATETKVQKQEAFRRLNFFAAWLLGWMSICLFWLYDPFIHIWLGGRLSVTQTGSISDRGELLCDWYAHSGSKYEECHGIVLGRALQSDSGGPGQSDRLCDTGKEMGDSGHCCRYTDQYGGISFLD